MYHCYKMTHRLYKMQDQKLLLLHWCSFSGWGRERVTSVFAVKGGQYHIYGCLQPITSEITQDARPKVIDTSWTLIFGMRQDVCRYCFCLWKQAKPHLLMFATNCDLGCPRCKARNRWCSVDDDIPNGALTVVLSLLGIQDANTSVVHSSDEITFQLHY